MLLKCVGCAETPTGAYGSLFTAAASRSLFPASLVCSCRSGEVSSAAGQAGCSFLLVQLTTQRRLLNQYQTETNVSGH